MRVGRENFLAKISLSQNQRGIAFKMESRQKERKNQIIRPYLKPYFIGFLAFLSLVCLFAGKSAAEETEFRLSRLARVECQLDGKLEEDFWKQLEPISRWYQLCPQEGEQPSEKTAMWLVYDASALYLGAKLYVRQASSIICRNLERDSYQPDQDAVGLILDTLNDNRTAYAFIVNSSGVRTDLAIANDAESMQPQVGNKDWNAFWDAAAAKDDGCWTVEMRIPFSSLRLLEQNNSATVGIILWRYVACNVEYDVFPPILNKWQFSAYKPSQALDVKLEGIKPSRPVYIKPYLLGGREHRNVFNESVLAYESAITWRRTAGLDLKSNLTSNFVLDVTLNTDFAQVEADDQQVNLTRFDLFFPEKRDFFQERSDLFSFRLPGGPQTLFHSRTIGLIEETAVPILAGVRLTGRSGRFELGLLEMQTDKARVDGQEYPAENFGVFRLKRATDANGSYVGALFTTRTDFKGNYSLLSCLDADIRFKGDNHFRLQIAESFEPQARPEKSLFATVSVSNQVRRGLSYGISGMHLGTQFNPALGFIYRNGINRLGSRFGYTWFLSRSPLVQYHGFQNRAEAVWNLAADRFETFEDTIEWRFLFRSGATFEAETKFIREWLSEPFSVGEVEIPSEEYRFAYTTLRFESSAGKPWRLKLETQDGGYYGGSQRGILFGPSVTLSSHLTLRLEYNWNRIKVPAGRYEAHLARFRIQSALSAKLSANAFVQYNSDTREVSTNFRVRYNPREGVDLYLVYNEGLNTELERAFPRLPRFNNRAILLKYSYTFLVD